LLASSEIKYFLLIRYVITSHSGHGLHKDLSTGMQFQSLNAHVIAGDLGGESLYVPSKLYLNPQTRLTQYFTPGVPAYVCSCSDEISCWIGWGQGGLMSLLREGVSDGGLIVSSCVSSLPFLLSSARIPASHTP
jgi:hypothetical protein